MHSGPTQEREEESWQEIPAFSLASAYAPEPIDAGEADAGDKASLMDRFLDFETPHGLYLGISGARFQWRQDSVRFDDGTVFPLEDDSGVGFAMGFRVNDLLSLELNGSWFPELYPKEDPLFAAALGEDGGHLGGAALLHYPLWRFLPYAGGGAGIMEVPDQEGTDIGFAPFFQGGVLFFLHKYLSVTADVKHLWGFVDNSQDHTAEALVYSFGIQVNVPLR